MAMRISCCPGFLNFVAVFARAAKNTHRHSKYLHQTKILAPTDISADMECARQIQTVIPVCRLKVFCLSQDVGMYNFFDILGDHSLKQGLSIGITFDPC
jgi:hypothetical protein